ncbi:hypothetical protein [Methanoregula sp.]|uniref:hypothetical protein n=1 Tax=Methanoregula sp. TaxID=2052170 RepID=UPI002CBEBBC1|nr:hypothetical protein [Methanoregula sp.]HVP96604.1 hypothetical protein [Methanoregula sp.]
MIQEPQIARVIPDFLPGSVTGVLPETCIREKFPGSHVTGEFYGSWRATSVSLQVIR